jgi:hypothetical protein
VTDVKGAPRRRSMAGPATGAWRTATAATAADPPRPVGGLLGVQSVVEGRAGQCPGSLQSGFQREARPFDHAVGGQDQRTALVQGEGLLALPHRATDRKVSDIYG